MESDAGIWGERRAEKERGGGEDTYMCLKISALVNTSQYVIITISAAISAH